MGNGLLAPLLGLLLVAGVALGESPASAPAASGEEKKLPDPESSQPELFSDLQVLVAAPGQLTFEADWLLATFPKRRDNFLAGATDILTAAGAAPLASLKNPQERHVIQGAQFSLGCWQTEANPWLPGGVLQTLGAEARAFFLGDRSLDFFIDRPPTIVRPFFDLNNRRESGVVVAAPGLATGALAATIKENFWGGEANIWSNLHYSCPGMLCIVDGMAGFRFLSYDEDITFGRNTLFFANLQSFPDFVPFAGNRFQENEFFTTHNRFYGGQIGIRGTIVLEEALVSATAKLALGATSQDLRIGGTQVRTAADGTQTVSQGALLALPSNIGRFHRVKFADVPELELKITCPVLDRLKVSLGFNSLYWSRIIRAVDQVQRDVDITQIPNFPGASTATPTGLARPGVPFNQSSLWVLGATLGAELCW